MTRTLPRGTQRLSNPGFELGNVGYLFNAAEFFIENDAATARSGSWRCRYQAAGVGGPNIGGNDLIPVRPGDRVYVAAWVRSPTGVGSAGVAVRWRDSANVPVGAREAVGGTLTGPVTGWTLQEGISGPAPTGAAFAVWDWGENSSDNSTTPWYIDDVEFRLAYVTDSERAEFVHLLELNFSGGSLYLNTGPQELLVDPLKAGARAVRIGATTARYLIRNPVGTWPTTNLTVEYWGRLDTGLSHSQTNNGFSYARSTQANEVLCNVDQSAGNWRQGLFINGASVLDTVDYPDDNAYHHLAWTWRSSDGAWAMYLDGALAASGTGLQTGYSIAGGGALVLGQDQDSLGGGFDSTQAWKGELDDVRVYDRVLSADEIAAHYNGVFTNEANLVGAWNFDGPGIGTDASPAVNLLTAVGIESATPETRDAIAWQAVGGSLVFGGIEESGDGQAQGVDLTLSGVDQTVLAALMTNNYRGRPVRIWRVWYDPVFGTVIGEPLLLLEGRQLSHYELQEERARAGGTVKIKTRVVGLMGLERIRGIWSNIVSHQHIFSGDTFFQYTPTLANVKVYWGTSTPTQINVNPYGPGGYPRGPYGPGH